VNCKIENLFIESSQIENMEEVVERLSKFPKLTELNLSDNDINELP